MTPCVPGGDHFFHGGECVICGVKLPCCANCRFGHDNHRDNGKLACGAGVDDGALTGEFEGVNPIWAVRKYSLHGIRAMLATSGGLPKGFDCQNLWPSDGRDCAKFEWRAES